MLPILIHEPPSHRHHLSPSALGRFIILHASPPRHHGPRLPDSPGLAPESRPTQAGSITARPLIGRQGTNLRVTSETSVCNQKLRHQNQDYLKLISLTLLDGVRMHVAFFVLFFIKCGNSGATLRRCIPFMQAAPSSQGTLLLAWGGYLVLGGFVAPPCPSYDFPDVWLTRPCIHLSDHFPNSDMAM